MRETTAAQCPIHPMETQPCPVCLATMDNSMASYNTGYAAGYRAARAECPPRDPTQAMRDAGLNYVAGNLHPGALGVWRAMWDAWQNEQTSGSTEGRAAGHDVATSIPADHGGDPTLRGEPSQSPAGIKPGPLDPCPNYGAMPPSLDRQPAATPSASVRDDAQHGAASAVTDGPAADPIADLCMQIRAFLADAPKEMPHEGYRYGELLSFAADALERLARERDVLSDTLADTRLRAERAEAERDAMREVVRAADAMEPYADAGYKEYKRARAKVVIP